MAEFKLTRAAPLGGYHEEIGTTSLREIDAARVETLCFPLSEDVATCAAARDLFGGPLPAVGTATLSAGTGAHILRLGADRLMILHLPDRSTRPDMAGALGAQEVTRVDQTDFWALLELAGPRAIMALERSCRLDLHAEVFAPGHLSRTPIDGVSTLLVRLEIDRFVLMAPRSYAQSITHSLLTSLRYVSG